MQIDWLTFGIQIVNFLILLVLLRRFLYRPIVNMMERREQHIKDQIEEADRKREEAEKEAASLREQRQAIEKRREEMLAEAEDAARERRHELIEEARAEIEETRSAWQATIQREKDDFLRDLRKRVGEQVFQVARRALADLADAELEQQMIRVFAARLQSGEAAGFSDALNDSQEAVITSAFELSDEAREHLTGALRERAGDQVDVRFEAEPELIGGILLKTNGFQLTWNLRDYLKSMEEHLVETLDDGTAEAMRVTAELEGAALEEPLEEEAE